MILEKFENRFFTESTVMIPITLYRGTDQEIGFLEMVEESSSGGQFSIVKLGYTLLGLGYSLSKRTFEVQIQPTSSKAGIVVGGWCDLKGGKAIPVGMEIFLPQGVSTWMEASRMALEKILRQFQGLRFMEATGVIPVWQWKGDIPLMTMRELLRICRRI